MAQYPETQAFINAVMARLGVATPADLAVKLGLVLATNRDVVREFQRWRAGSHRPRLDKIMPLMQAAGMLDADPAIAPPDYSLEAISRKLDAVLDRLPDRPLNEAALTALNTNRRTASLEGTAPTVAKRPARRRG